MEEFLEDFESLNCGGKAAECVNVIVSAALDCKQAGAKIYRELFETLLGDKFIHEDIVEG